MLGSVRDEVAPVIGREQEQRLLTSVLDEVAARDQALVLRGEADIGKSRLISDTA
jgi:predicted ATPase